MSSVESVMLSYNHGLHDTSINCTAILAKKRKIKNRRWWIHPVLSNRMSQGQFIATYNEPRTNEGKFNRL